LYEGWREDVIKCRAITEAIIDFGEDDEIEDSVCEDGIHSTGCLPFPLNPLIPLLTSPPVGMLKF
jgi:hypothetical protein